jgi:hypothetical protein
MAFHMTVLPTGESLNPANPDVRATYYDQNTCVYVLFKVNESRTRPTRVMTSFGGLKNVRIGTELELWQDQTQRHLGRYRVDGVKDFKTGEQAGNVPDIKIKHCVVK